MIISLAPLQGYTEYPFRNALAKIIGGINKFYTPYLRFENDGSIRSKHIKDILPENNLNIPLTPQILVNSASDFLKMTTIIEDYGYTEVNWNLGCPYPMVAKRKLGSGLLASPETIHQILDEVLPKTKLQISIKMRSGYMEDTDSKQVIEILNQFPLSEIIFHPRIGKQLYKGNADVQKFAEIQKLSKILLAYNGDIDSVEKFIEIQQLLPEQNHFMIGRGLIANPFLAKEIVLGKSLSSDLKRMHFEEFHSELFAHFSKELSGDSHLLNKFIHFWEYFSLLFTDEKHSYKAIKKSRSVNELIKNISYIIRNNSFKS